MSRRIAHARPSVFGALHPAGVAAAAAIAACASVHAPAPVRADDPPPGDIPTGFPAPCPARAVGCDLQNVDYTWRAALFDTIDLDTGWVPASSPIQLRFGFRLASATEIELGGTAVTSWPVPLDFGLVGRPGTGRLSLDYGYEIIARLRIDVTIAGARYDWEGNIPIPGGIPRDIGFRATTTFDPFVLPGARARPVTVADTTMRFRVFSYDALGSFVPIPGIGGGVAVDLEGMLEAAYRSERVVVAGSPAIEREGGTTRVLPDEGADDYGAAKDIVAHPEGVVEYDGALVVHPTLYVELVGRRFDYTIVSIPIPIVDASDDVVFDDQTIHVPLPALGMLPTRIDLGDVDVGASAEALLDIRNDGEAPLVVRPRMPPRPFDVRTPELMVSPRSTARMVVACAPTAPGPAAANLLLDTNDPDDPSALVMLRCNGNELPPPPDAGAPDLGVSPPGGPSDAGGCGCRAAGAASARRAGDGPARAGGGGGADALGLAAAALGLSAALARRARGRAVRA